MRVLGVILSLGLGLGAATGAAAQQSETLADIRQGLAVLDTELRRLKTELNTSAAPGGISGGSVLDRITAIESELQRLTAKSEELEFRIDSVVRDGTNRLGDLEFRLCELDTACDIGSLGETRPIGGQEEMPMPQTSAGGAGPSTNTGPQLAVAEEIDFKGAQNALAEGDYTAAASLFATFRDSYPGSPLEPDALMGQGAALEALGDTREAARMYLDAFSGYPEAQIAPVALTRLGITLGALGKTAEACVTLSEVAVRYPGAGAVSDAQTAMADLACQ